jgi:hypothetical protein
MKLCRREGCSKPVLARGLCVSHYRRMMKGLPGEPREKAPAGHALEFLKSLVGTPETECITWPFKSKTRGYGRVKFGGKMTIASRVVCEFAHGKPAVPTLEAAHLCGKGHLGCVNPNHLEWKTPLENEADKIPHGTLMIGAKNHKTVLEPQEVRAIRRALGRGETQASLAAQYNVNRGTIHTLKSGRSWAHVV